MSNMISNFFIFCSGADADLLKTCPQFERNKYASIGATVFFTGIFAGLASGYAMYRVFHNDEYALLYALTFSIFWGLMIFNLDRYIVSSMKKTGTLKTELFTALPRFIIAIIISLVIAKPLEVKLFSDRIATEINTEKIRTDSTKFATIRAIYQYEKKEKGLKNSQANLAFADSMSRTKPIDQAFLNLEADLKECKNRLARKKNVNYPKIRDIKNNIRRIENDGSNYMIGDDRKKKFYIGAQTQLDKLQGRRVALNREVSSIKNKCEGLKNDIQTAITNHQDFYGDKKVEFATQVEVQQEDYDATTEIVSEEETIAEQANKKSYSENFITQVEALGRLTKWKNDGSSNTMWWSSILIMLLFILIETAPVIVKLLSKKGIYDEKLLEKELLALGTIQDDVQTQIALNKANNEHILQVDLSSNKTLLEKITNAQIEIAEKVVEKWKQDELNKMNP